MINQPEGVGRLLALQVLEQDHQVYFALVGTLLVHHS